jgi:hypothetical protein
MMHRAVYPGSAFPKALRSKGLSQRAAALALIAAGFIGLTHAAAFAQQGDDSQKTPSFRVSLPLNLGYVNSQQALYITPEVGTDPSAPASVVTAAQQLAVQFHANYIPGNFASLANSPAVDDIFSFTNFKQGNVLASSPHPAGPTNTDTNYSPLWQVSLVTWNPGFTGRTLISQDQITQAAAKGEVTVQKTPIIVECSVVFTPSGGLLPGARITPSDRDGDRDQNNR